MKKKEYMNIFSIFSLIILAFFLTGMATRPAGMAGGGNHDELLNIITPIIIIIIAFLTPIYKGYFAAKEAEKFKTLVFVTTYFEWLGWILCITIIGIPFGLGLVLVSQSAHLQIKSLLEQNQKLET